RLPLAGRCWYGYFFAHPDPASPGPITDDARRGDLDRHARRRSILAGRQVIGRRGHGRGAVLRGTVGHRPRRDTRRILTRSVNRQAVIQRAVPARLWRVDIAKTGGGPTLK